ncbi:MAG: hypothetical protein WC783_00175 [Candidatus Paceibacterota bacterium]|jgi:hypothetical protein
MNTNKQVDYGVLDYDGKFTPCKSYTELADLVLNICNKNRISYGTSLTNGPFCSLEQAGYVIKRVFWETNWENRLYDMDRAGLTRMIFGGSLSTSEPKMRYVTKEQINFMYSTVDSLDMLYYIDENFTTHSYGIKLTEYDFNKIEKRASKIKELKRHKGNLNIAKVTVI